MRTKVKCLYTFLNTIFVKVYSFPFFNFFVSFYLARKPKVNGSVSCGFVKIYKFLNICVKSCIKYIYNWVKKVYVKMNASAFEYLNLAFKQRLTILRKKELVLLDNIILKKSFNFIFKRFNFSYIYVLKVIFFNTSLAGVGLYFWWNAMNLFCFLKAEVWLAIIFGLPSLQLIFFTYSLGLPASFVSSLKMTWSSFPRFIEQKGEKIFGNNKPHHS